MLDHSRPAFKRRGRIAAMPSYLPNDRSWLCRGCRPTSNQLGVQRNRGVEDLGHRTILLGIAVDIDAVVSF